MIDRQIASPWHLTVPQVVQCENGETARYVEAQFMGLHKKGFVQPGEWHPVTLWPPLSFRSVWETGRYFLNVRRPHVVVKVFNARDQEAIEGLSKREFFEKHGFVLLKKETAMTAERTGVDNSSRSCLNS
ncbi:Uncharacterized protein SCF082_LOCUS45641 [Durusdinium trenchii]|uniref:Uncharacterized protein n=1 Tax=Durusdinium trenchii TaxID=1381693 RepID=A0ABP0R9P1_9DINO